MQQPEAHDHGIEAGIRERQRLGVALLEFNSRIFSACFGEHRHGEVDADDARTELRCRGGDITRPGRYIEEPRAASNIHGIEQPPDGLYGEVAEGFMVLRRNILPSRLLEGFERAGVSGW